MSESSVEKSSGFFRQLDDRGRDSEEGYKQPGESKNADDDVAPGGLSGPGAPGIRGHNSDAKVPERPSHSSSSPGTAAWPYTRSTVLRRDPSYQHCTQEGQDTGGDPRNTNNSANTSDCDSEPQRVSTDRNREARPSRRLTEQFSFIKEAPWFQNLVTYLRHNLTRLVEERRNRSQRNRESSTSCKRDGEGMSETGQGTSSTYHCGSYFEKLKASKHGQRLPRGNRKENQGSTVCFAHATAGSERQSETKKGTFSYQCGSYFKKLEASKQRLPRGNKKENQGSTVRFVHATAGGERLSETEKGTFPTHLRGAYFEKLKAGKSEEVGPPGDGLKTTDLSHPGCGDQAHVLYEEGDAEVSCFDKLQDRMRHPSRPPRVDISSTEKLGKTSFSNLTGGPSVSPAPHTCWFCGTVPGQKQTIRHLQALSLLGGCSNGEDRASSSSGKPHAKAQSNEPRSEAAKQGQTDAPEITEEIPFDTIMRYHDYEYEQAGKKGTKALRVFKRRAAQCIAEDFLNSNTNSASASTAEERSGRPAFRKTVTNSASSEADVVIKIEDEREGRANGCRRCMENTYHRIKATVLCVLCCKCRGG